MAFELTTRALLKSQQTGVKPNLILKIEGIDEIFGQVDVTKLAKYGDEGLLFGNTGLVYGGTTPLPESRPWISLQQTSRNITQQLLQDKGGTSSVSNVKIQLVDKDNTLTQIFSPGNTISDILGAEAKVYLSFDGAAFPEDAIEIFSGICEGSDAGASYWNLTISHPEQLRRQEIFQQVTSKLDGAITDSDTTITLDSVIGLLEETTEFETYVVIEDEIIRYTGISGNDLTGCTRGSLNTINVSHDDDVEIVSFYRIQGKPIQTALKVMLSDPDNEFIEENTPLLRVYYKNGSEIVDGLYVFDEVDIEQRLGLTVGDLFSVSGTLNDFTDQPIIELGKTDDGKSYVQVAPSGGAFEESEPTGTADFKSPWNVLPDGLRMKTSQCDVKGHLDIEDFYGSTFPTYDLYIKETVIGKEFIESQLYFPASLYNVPRKGRVGVAITSAPLATENIKLLDGSSVSNPDKLKITRTINKNFYNSVVYKTNEDSLTDKRLTNVGSLDTDSSTRIPVGNRTLTIDAPGLRDDESTQNFIQRTIRRYFDRYKFGAELIKNVETNYKTGFNIEPSDIVILNKADLGLADSTDGTRAGKERLYECVNKKLDVVSGKVSIDILDTGFGLDGRFTVIGPASNTRSGSSTSIIRLAESYSTLSGQRETLKWEDYIGLQITVRTQDFSVSETTQLIRISPTIKDALEVFPALSSPPSEDYVVEAAGYDQADDKWKLLHPFWCPQEEVSSGTSDTVFDVVDATNVFEEAIIRVHSDDFTTDSPEVTIIDVTGTTITVNNSLGFTPSAGQKVDLIGFVSDKGFPYRYL